VAVLSLCALAAFAIATEGASAALPRLRLLSNGTQVPANQRTAVINTTSFPGFTCQGFNGAMHLERNPAVELKFAKGGEGGGEAFSSCETGSGEPVSTATEGPAAKLSSVTVSRTTVTERFVPAVVFEDNESGCVWELHKLAGPLPSSGPLEAIPVSGTLRLLAHLSARTCSGPGEASGTATIEAAPEGAPPGSYEVERVG
jgi:hypothetical protein